MAALRLTNTTNQKHFGPQKNALFRSATFWVPGLNNRKKRIKEADRIIRGSTLQMRPRVLQPSKRYLHLTDMFHFRNAGNALKQSGSLGFRVPQGPASGDQEGRRLMYLFSSLLEEVKYS